MRQWALSISRIRGHVCVFVGPVVLGQVGEFGIGMSS